MDLAGKAAHSLARRSSRRRLARGELVPHTDGRLARLGLRLRRLRRRALQPVRRHWPDLRQPESAVPMQDLPAGRGLPRRLFYLGRVVLLSDRHRVPPALLGVQLPDRMLEPLLSLLHAARHAVHATAALAR